MHYITGLLVNATDRAAVDRLFDRVLLVFQIVLECQSRLSLIFVETENVWADLHADAATNTIFQVYFDGHGKSRPLEGQILILFFNAVKFFCAS